MWRRPEQTSSAIRCVAHFVLLEVLHISLTDLRIMLNAELHTRSTKIVGKAGVGSPWLCFFSPRLWLSVLLPLGQRTGCGHTQERDVGTPQAPPQSCVLASQPAFLPSHITFSPLLCPPTRLPPTPPEMHSANRKSGCSRLVVRTQILSVTALQREGHTTQGKRYAWHGLQGIASIENSGILQRRK